MAAKGIHFPWLWDGGTISTNLDGIWGMSENMAFEECQLEQILVTGSIQLDCLLAAAAGAAGNRVRHWQKAKPYSSRTFFYALAYVVSGGVIGFFFGVYFTNFLIALVFGGVWPVAVEAREPAQFVIETLVKSIKNAGSATKAISDILTPQSESTTDDVS